MINMNKIRKILLFVLLLVMLVGVASATEVSDNATTDTSCVSNVVQDNNMKLQSDTLTKEVNKEIEDQSFNKDDSKPKNINKKTINKTDTKKESIISVTNWAQLNETIAAIQSKTENTTIILQEGTYNSNNEINWTNTNIVLTIDGNGQTIVANENMVFNISSNSYLILKNITIKNAHPVGYDGGAIYNKGTLTIKNSILENNTIIPEPTDPYATTYGGAIYNRGILTVINSTLRSNSAIDGGAIYNEQDSTLILNDSILNNNYAIKHGGAIHNKPNGTLIVNKSTLRNNTVQSIGGAIFNDGVSFIHDSTFKNNKAYDGGAISTYKFLSVMDSTFESNSASNQGGAIEIYNIGQYTPITNSNFTANIGKSGGAIYSYGYLNATGNRFTNNMATFNETINLRGYTNGIFEDNIYENNDIYLSERTIRIKDDQNIFLYGEDVVLNITIEVYYKDFYKDFFEGVNDITLYINDEKNRTVKYGNNITLSNLEQGTYTAYFTSSHLRSNNVTFYVIIDYERNVSNYTQLVEAIDSTKEGLYNIYTINLLPGDYNATQTIFWNNSFTKTMIINGNGITINGGNINSRFITIIEKYNLTINNITITNFTSTDDAGVLYNQNGFLTIADSTFENNHGGGWGGVLFSFNLDNEFKLVNSTFRNNSADLAGGAIYVKGFLNSTGNKFIDNHSINETINLGTFTDAIFKDNTYENTDINLSEKTLTTKDNQNVFVYGESVVLNYSIQPTYSQFYKDFADGINDITLYINDEKNRTLKYGDNITLSNLEIGTYTAYFTTCNQQSNNVTFKIITDLETNVSNYNELVEAIGNASSEQYNIYTINLLPGDYNATQNITWSNSETHNITINGNGNTLNGKNRYQFIFIATGYNLTLENITIVNYTAEDVGAIRSSGNLTITNSTLNNNIATNGDGGAVYSTGNLTITNSTLNNNIATNGVGGAVYSTGNLTITNSTLNNNIATYGSGGAIRSTGNLIVKNSTLNNNTASYYGGAIITHSILTLIDSTLENNNASYGGAIWAPQVNQYIKVVNSTFTNNDATTSGGAIFSYGYLNATGNTFNNNHAKNKETIDLYGYSTGIFNNNTYNNTDINLTQISLSIKNYKTVYDYYDDIVFNYSIHPAQPYNYKDFKEGLIDITLYLNDQKNITTKYENNLTISRLAAGTYTAYFTTSNQKSNNVTFTVEYIDKDRRITELQEQLNNASNEINNLNNTIQEQNNIIQEKNNTINSLNNTINTLNNTVQEQNNTINALNDTINTLNNTVQEQNNTINALNDTINTLNNTVEEQDNTINSLNNTVQEQNTTINNLNNNITNLTKELENAGTEIENLNNTVQNQTKTINDLNNTIQEQDSTIRDLQEQIDELKKAKNTTITIDEITDAKYNENVTISGALVNDDSIGLFNQIVTLTIGENTVNVTTKDGVFEYTTVFKELGDKTVTASYTGTDKYKESEANMTFTVEKQDILITYDEIKDTPFNDNVTITGKFTEVNGKAISNSNVNVYINGKQYKARTDKTGAFSLSAQVKAVGTNNVTFSYGGNAYYNSYETNTTFNAPKQDLIITYDTITSVKYNDNVTITVKFTDKNVKSITKSNVNVYINGKQYKARTDTTGAFTLSVQTRAIGINNVTFTYGGNTYYNNYETSTTFNVEKQDLLITYDSIQDTIYGNNVTITGKFTDKNGKAITKSNVNIYINGKQYKAKTDTTGSFILSVATKTVGTNNVTFTYGGNTYYNSYETSTTFNVITKTE